MLRRSFGGMLAGSLFLCGTCAFALNPALDVSQYAHTAWTVRGGLSKGTIVAITQTQDGYLWLGTEFGLLRFDGAKFVPWQPPANQNLPSTYIHSLLAARDGRLWIGTAEGLASWKDGKLTRYAELAGQSIAAMIEDREGTVWAGGHAAPAGKLCAMSGDRVQCFGMDGSFGQYVDALFEDKAGNLWVAGLTGLWRWKPGAPKLYPLPDRVLALMDGDNGALVIVMASGVRQFASGQLGGYPLPATGSRFTARQMLRDRDGGLWIGTADRGLVHLHQERADVFARSDDLSSDFVEMMFEDREGNIWVATLDGLDRFREFTVPTISNAQGLSNAAVKSVVAGRDGSVWLGTGDGLNQWNQGQVTIYRARSAKGTTSRRADVREISGSGLPDDAIQSIFQDFRDRIWVSTRRGVAVLENGRFTPIITAPGEVHSIAGDRAGNVWVSHSESLYHLRDTKVIEEIPWSKLGRPDGARALAADATGDGLWIAWRDGGVAYFKDHQVRRSYTPADGLGEAHVRDIQLDQKGRVWASTEGGLSRLKDDRFVTLNGKNGLPCDSVHWVIEDDDHSFWLYMACGLVRIAGSDLEAWMVAASKDPARRLEATVFDSSDGVRSHSTTTGYSPSVAKSTDGRLWFLPWDGVSVIDPRHLPFNRLPAPVHIETITADRKTYDAIPGGKGDLRLPSLIQDLEIDYTALSLAAPEKVQFRYKLEGWDRDWQEAGNRRQAFYNNLSPGSYRFRVNACNSSGVWNEAGTFLDFSVAPAYYQTIWFRLACVAAFLALLAGLYALRLRHVTQQYNIRLEERVGERTRIAQELHDSLLQGFLSVSMHVHVATDRLPEESPVKPILVKALEQMRQVIDEGRNALRGLRTSKSASPDLEHAFSQVRQELGPLGQEDVEFRVIVEGDQRPLRPSLRDEVYRIGREALINAFRHSRASQIEIELKYSEKQLRVFVRDNGSGIDPNILTAGRAGHWGLSGMRERADRIGAQLHVLSSSAAGTEIELAVPARLAFQ
ncbi:MAG TPA: two-component regulator propeller domain-containing protein, partial [Bryobacteraceae bacterium]|nr:two-component regulator propeller domain-containing protein [Bryobacteraceae bacterium]